MDYKLLGSAQLRALAWRCDGPMLVMPFTDAPQAQRACVLMSKRAGADGLLLAVHDDRREGFIGIANQAFAISDSPLFGYVAQDAFAGRHWLRHALEALRKPSVHLLAFNDGKWFGTLAAYGLTRRDWAAKNYGGALFFEGYRSHYADTELSLLAAEADGLGYSPHAVLVEMDWEKEAKPVEARDRELFRARVRTGFDGRVRSKSLLERFN